MKFKWTASLDKNDKNYEHHLLEGLWVSWGVNEVDIKLLNQLLNAEDFRARAAAVRVVRYNGDKISNQIQLLKKSAQDQHGRVRLETMVAASWLDKKDAMPILEIIKSYPLDDWMKPTYETIVENFASRIKKEVAGSAISAPEYLTNEEKELFTLGRNLYIKDGNCATCHQYDGKGVEASGFPSLSKSDWVLGDEKRLIKITLNGLLGPITVSGKKYEGKTPMLPYAGLLNDKEIAAILTYVRNTFGNKMPGVSEKTVKQVREETKEKKGFYKNEEL